MSSFVRQLGSVAGELATAAADIVSNKTELEKKLDEALSKANWGASSTLLREIASATNNPYNMPIIMKQVWAALDHAGKNWRQIYKGLVLLESLVKNGSERCVDEARDHVFRVRTLMDFTHQEGGKDQGAGIREVAKRLVDLLGDTARLREERKKAKELQSSVIGINNDGVPSMSSIGSGGGGGGGSMGSSSYGGPSAGGRSSVVTSGRPAPAPAAADDWSGGAASGLGGFTASAATGGSGPAGRSGGHGREPAGGRVRRPSGPGADSGSSAAGTSAGAASDIDFAARHAQRVAARKGAAAGGSTGGGGSDWDADPWAADGSAGTSAAQSTARSTGAHGNAGASNGFDADPFDAFGTAPATSAPSLAPRMTVGITSGARRPSGTAAPAAAPPRLMGPPGGKPPAPVPAQSFTSSSSSSFDPFSSAPAPAARAAAPPADDFGFLTSAAPVTSHAPPAPVTHSIDDLFSAPAATSAPLYGRGAPTAGAAAAAAADPFGAFGSAPATTAASSADPFGAFGTPAPAQRSESFTTSAAGASFGSPADAFGSFSSAPAAKQPKDDDVDRLVALDGLSLKDAKTAAPSTPAGKTSAPLRTLMAASSQAPASTTPVMRSTPGTGAVGNGTGFGGMGGLGGMGVGGGISGGMAGGFVPSAGAISMMSLSPMQPRLGGGMAAPAPAAAGGGWPQSAAQASVAQHDPFAMPVPSAQMGMGRTAAAPAQAPAASADPFASFGF